MQRLLQRTIYVFLAIFAATAALTLAGLGSLWFRPSSTGALPYLGSLISALVIEVIGVIVVFAKRGMRYLPEVQKNRTVAETDSFMKDLIAHGSSVTIVSNRLAWLIDAREVQEEMIRRVKSGAKFEIITSRPVVSPLREELAAHGVEFIVVGLDHVPEARFTLINADRCGAERLAIAKGTHPNHEITIFDADSGPQIIGMAKDIVRKSKALVNAT